MGWNLSYIRQQLEELPSSLGGHGDFMRDVASVPPGRTSKSCGLGRSRRSTQMRSECENKVKVRMDHRSMCVEQPTAEGGSET